MLLGEFFVLRGLGILLLAVEVFLVCRIIDGAGSRAAKILWAMAILLCSPIGAMLYLLLKLTRDIWIRRLLFTLAAIGEVIFAGAYLATVVPLERQALSTPKAAPATHPVHVGNAQ